MRILKFAGLAAFAATMSLAAFAGPASAHVWNIGWQSSGGGLTFYGVSYHTGSVGGAGSVDDFSANPAGFVINGNNVTFDAAVTNLNDCIGAGGLTSGTCSPGFNALNVDGALHANGYSSDYYGKLASVALDAAQLALLGIGTGANSVLLSTFSNNVHWAGLTFSSASVPINIVVTPQVPLPAALPLLGSALAGLGFVGWRRRKKTLAAA